MSGWGRVVGLAVGLGLGCTANDIFVCSDHDDCTGGAGAGTCQASGYCSFPDDTCTSGERYGDHAGGGLAGHCVPDPSGGTGSTDDGSDATSSTSATSTTSTTSSGTTTTDATTGDGTTVAVDDTGSTTTGGGLPPGSSCSDDSECEGYCYVIGLLGGTCGECSEHDHCPNGGCNAPNPLAEPPQGSVCGMGTLGDGCGDNTDCESGACVTIIDVTGIATFDTCGECSPGLGQGCAFSEVCNPNVDFQNFGGYYECVPSGSVPLGGTCDPAAFLDACDTGICAAASLMGLLDIGVCSECDDDADCGADGVCTPATVDLEGGAVPGLCN